MTNGISVYADESLYFLNNTNHLKLNIMSIYYWIYKIEI